MITSNPRRRLHLFSARWRLHHLTSLGTAWPWPCPWKACPWEALKDVTWRLSRCLPCRPTPLSLDERGNPQFPKNMGLFWKYSKSPSWCEEDKLCTIKSSHQGFPAQGYKEEQVPISTDADEFYGRLFMRPISVQRAILCLHLEALC